LELAILMALLMIFEGDEVGGEVGNEVGGEVGDEVGGEIGGPTFPLLTTVPFHTTIGPINVRGPFEMTLCLNNKFGQARYEKASMYRNSFFNTSLYFLNN